MCRLLGFVSAEPVPLTELLGERELTEFTELSAKHGDGWGFAWATADGVEIAKAPDAARDSELFARLAHERRADLGLLHLRWATLGLGVMAENTHPFSDGTLAFAHNGSVRPPESIDRFVPSEFAELQQGSTDSERYFLATLAAFRTGDPETALERAAALIADVCTFSSLNAMTVTATELQALCLFDPIAEAREAEPHYYRMGYRVTDDSVVVSSSGWGDGWTYLSNGEILTVNRATRDVSIRAVDHGPVEG